MTSQPLNKKSVAIALLSYIVLTVILAVILMTYWQMTFDTQGMSQQQLTELAANSSFIIIGSSIIGALSAMAVSFFMSRKAQGNEYKQAIALAVLLTAYGALSIYLNPEQLIWQQIAKLVTPLPICLFGAWLSNIFTAKNSNRATPQFADES